MSDLALFDMEPPAAAAPAEKMSADRRRTLRQLALLDAGCHPLSAVTSRPLRLHRDAPPPGDREAPGPRCGTCRFREQTTSNGNKSFPKCLRGWDGNPMHEPPYASHGAATDCRAWWPACSYWEAVQA